jgi:hypothetical protein
MLWPVDISFGRLLRVLFTVIDVGQCRGQIDCFGPQFGYAIANFAYVSNIQRAQIFALLACVGSNNPLAVTLESSHKTGSHQTGSAYH